MGKIYYIMNKDNIIGKAKLTRDSRLVLLNHGKLPKFLCDKQKWVKHRFGANNRSGVVFYLDFAGYETVEEIYDVTHMISINDTMWLKSENSNTKWEDINPYKNNIDNDIAELFLYGANNIKQLKSSIKYKCANPQLSIDGTANKCVRRLSNKIVLQKISKEKYDYGNRQHSEYAASEFRKLLGIPGVDYRIKVDGEYIVSECNLFTDEKIGFIAAGDTKLGDCGINELMKRVSDTDKLQIKQMMMLDALTINIDRHRWNYGFIFDNDTFEIKGLAPIFDNDMALLAMDFINYDIDFEYNYLGFKYRTSKQGRTNFYDNMLEYNYDELHSRILDIDGKVEIPYIEGLYNERQYLLNKVINQRLNDYKRLINGECIYERF